MLTLVLAMVTTGALAHSLGGLARVTGTASVAEVWRGVTLTLPISQPVPWRTRLLADPPRAVVDFRTLDWTGVEWPDPLPQALRGLRTGDAGGGWSRLVIDLRGPMGFDAAGLAVDAETGQAVLTLTLGERSEADFAAELAALSGETAGQIGPSGAAARVPLGLRPTVIVLDPGHGGVDPGAVHERVRESDITLTFARELAALLRRSGRYEVVLTRDADVFVSLEGRIAMAHAANADLFVSLHADAVTDGQAFGATVYTLAEEATDAASAALAERHDRDNIVGGGVELGDADDAVAGVLMDLARAETQPATHRLAQALVAAIQGADIRMHRFPWQQAAFSVLKSATVPSVLLEIGFLSSERDRVRLTDADWRAGMAQAVMGGIDAWVLDEAAIAARLRR